MKDVWELSVQFLQFFCKSKIIAKLKIRVSNSSYHRDVMWIECT